MAHVVLIGMNVAAQRAELARLDAVSRLRALSPHESAWLAELLRLDAERARWRRRALTAQRARAEARLAQLAGAAA